MKRQIRWLSYVVCALGVCGTTLAGVDETVNGQADSTEKPAKTIHLPEEAATMHAESEKLCEQFGKVEKRTCVAAFHIYSAGFELSKQANSTEQQTEKVRLYDEAATMYTKAAKLYEQLGEHKSCAKALKNAGDALHKQAANTEGQTEKISLYDEAVAKFIEAAKLYEQLEAKKERAEALGDAGSVLFTQFCNAQFDDTEKRAEAIHLFNDAAKLYEQLGDKRGRAFMLVWSGFAELNAPRLLLDIAEVGPNIGMVLDSMWKRPGRIAEVWSNIRMVLDSMWKRPAEKKEKISSSKLEEIVARLTEATVLFEQLGDEQPEQLGWKLGRVAALFLTGAALSYQAYDAEQQTEKVRLCKAVAAKFTEMAEFVEQSLKLSEQPSEEEWGAMMEAVGFVLSTISRVVSLSAASIALQIQARNTEQRTEKVQLHEEAVAKFTEIASLLTEEIRFKEAVQLLLPFAGEYADADKTEATVLVLDRVLRRWALQNAGLALLNQADDIENRTEKARLCGEAVTRFYEEVKLREQKGWRWFFPSEDRRFGKVSLALKKQAANTEKLGEKARLYKEAVKLIAMDATMKGLRYGAISVIYNFPVTFVRLLDQYRHQHQHQY